MRLINQTITTGLKRKKKYSLLTLYLMEQIVILKCQIACRSEKKKIKNIPCCGGPDTQNSEGFLFMATILQRFKHLGLAHNNKILMIVGQHIAKEFQQDAHSFAFLEKIEQKEGDKTFMVWNYPEFWNKDMDHLIINFLENYLK